MGIVRLAAQTVPLLLALLSAALSFGRHFVLQWVIRGTRPAPIECGATFSARYAGELGLDGREALADTVSDFGIRRLRLPVYWDEVEPEPGRFRWDTLDWQMEAALRLRATVLLAVGHKAPRYPEYFAPLWAAALPEEQFQPALMRFVAAVVLRFREHPALEAWQVENEPLAGFAGWRFGVGSRDVAPWLPEEIRLVRFLDPGHPVVVTYADVPWVASQLPATLRFDADIVGVSVYSRTYWNSPFYRGHLDLSRLGMIAPLSLEYQAWLVGRRGRAFWVTELQAEPWAVDPGGLLAASPQELARTMSREQLERSWKSAAGAGSGRIYLWGVEWLLAQRQRGRDGDILALVRRLAAAGRCDPTLE